MFTTGRGGQLTYHGPGQRVAYVMLDLKRRRPDVRAYVAGLEEWIIRTLAAFNVRGERREDRVGVWVAGLTRGGLRRQDRRDRRAPAALGVVPRHRHQCRAGAVAFRAIVPAASTTRATASPAWSISASRDHGGCRCRAPAGLCGSVRRREGAPAGGDGPAVTPPPLRRDIELACHVSSLLRQPAIAVGVAADFMDMDVGFRVQRPEQFAHPLEHRGDEGRLLVLGVGAVGDVDVEPVAGELLLRQRTAACEPVGGVDDLTMTAVTLGSLCRIRRVRSRRRRSRLSAKASRVRMNTDGNERHDGLLK